MDYIIYPIDDYIENYQVLRYSKYDSTSDLFDRVEQLTGGNSFTLWKVERGYHNYKEVTVVKN